MFCEKCGKELHKDASFCSYCGAKVERYDEVKHNTISIERNDAADCADSSSQSIFKKILSGLGTVVSLFIFLLAATIGKQIVHDPSAVRVLSYVLPGVLVGGVFSLIAHFIYGKYSDNTKTSVKLMIWIIPLVAGVIVGVYGAAICGILLVIGLFATSKKQ